MYIFSKRNTINHLVHRETAHLENIIYLIHIDKVQTLHFAIKTIQNIAEIHTDLNTFKITTSFNFVPKLQDMYTLHVNLVGKYTLMLTLTKRK